MSQLLSQPLQPHRLTQMAAWWLHELSHGVSVTRQNSSVSLANPGHGGFYLIWPGEREVLHPIAGMGRERGCLHARCGVLYLFPHPLQEEGRQKRRSQHLGHSSRLEI